MAGRIREEDIAAIRERVQIEEVVREFVTLKSAGGGNYKGLCPFHDERSPSFHVTPSKQIFHCFGCGEGGDAFAFLQKIEHIGFVDAVERLAEKVGVEVQYDDDTDAAERRENRGQRTRLLHAHRDAAEFYRKQMLTQEAQTGVTFLKERGFTFEHAAQFSIGYSPKAWDTLSKHLRSLGYSDDELILGGLSTRNDRGGIYDKFRGRLMWPIRNASSEVIGFGARKLYDDDQGPKYLNTSETPLYKKSQVLYGIDLARKDIATKRQAVVVEGYTDVMACYLSGVTTAVASCGTAFGTEHIGIIRRLLKDDDRMSGEVIFTFDGDKAGQKAALKAFEEDQRFVARTFVAVEPHGMDPCEVRIARGEEGVRELLANKVPLFEFAIKSMLAEENLNLPEGRVAALQRAAPVVAQIKDPALRPEYVRLLSGWLGMDVDVVRRSVNSGANPGKPARNNAVVSEHAAEWELEREALKCVLQYPTAAAAWFSTVEDAAWTTPEHLAAANIVLSANPSEATDMNKWTASVIGSAEDEETAGLIRELIMEPLASDNSQYVTSAIAQVIVLDAGRRIARMKSELQQASSTDRRNQLMLEMMQMENYRREMLETVHAVNL